MVASTPAAPPPQPNPASPAQRGALEHGVGPLLIIAGPGSGKSFALNERIVRLIHVEGAAPESPLVIRFIEKTDAEFTDRVSIRLLQLGARVNPKEM